jgi:integral membrane protein
VSTFLDFKSVDGALLRYRVVATVVGISILILVFVGIPLGAAGYDEVNFYLGLPHGVLFYPLYWLVTLDLARRVHLHPLWALLILGLGTVPILSFWAEHRTTQLVRERQATALAAEPTSAPV